MPLYEYRCLKCKRHTEKIENMNGPHLNKCPHCGGKVESVLTAPAIQFKGSGWYVTDYGKGDSGPRKKEKESDAGTKSETSSETKAEKKAESGGEAAKPAGEKKTETKKKGKKGE